MATSIKGMLQDIMGEETSIYVGKVSSVNPVSIKLQDDSGLNIGSSLLIIPEHLTDRKVKINIDGEEKDIILCDALSSGEEVHVLALSHGSLYYVLGRC